MKKLVAIIFFFLYFFASAGATIQLHYCMDKLVGWSLSSKGGSKCGKCGMAKKGHKGCCHDENKFIKLNKDYKTSSVSLYFLALTFPIHKNSWEHTVCAWMIYLTLSNPGINAPPPRNKVPIYLSNAVFRI